MSTMSSLEKSQIILLGVCLCVFPVCECFADANNRNREIKANSGFIALSGCFHTNMFLQRSM